MDRGNASSNKDIFIFLRLPQESKSYPKAPQRVKGLRATLMVRGLPQGSHDNPKRLRANPNELMATSVLLQEFKGYLKFMKATVIPLELK